MNRQHERGGARRTFKGHLGIYSLNIFKSLWQVLVMGFSYLASLNYSSDLTQPLTLYPLYYRHNLLSLVEITYPSLIYLLNVPLANKALFNRATSLQNIQVSL